MTGEPHSLGRHELGRAPEVECAGGRPAAAAAPACGQRVVRVAAAARCCRAESQHVAEVADFEGPAVERREDVLGL